MTPRSLCVDEVPLVSVNACQCRTFKSCLCRAAAGTIRHYANVLFVYLDKPGVPPFACRYVVRAASRVLSLHWTYNVPFMKTGLINEMEKVCVCLRE